MTMKMTMTDWLICFLIPLQICSHMIVTHVSINHIYIFLVGIVAAYGIQFQNIFIYSNEMGIYAGAVLCFCILPVLNFHIGSLSGLFYIGLLMLFLVSCDVIGRRLDENGTFIIPCWGISAAVAADYMVLKNIDEINENTIRGIFYTSDEVVRYRAKFGFSHANFAGMVFITVLLLNYAAFCGAKRRKDKNLFLFLMLLNIIPLLCTGSRTACICGSIFVGFEMVFKFLPRIANARLKSGIRLILGFLLLVLALNLNINVDFEGLSDISSGRLETIAKGLETLRGNGSLWFGYIVSNVSQANAALSGAGASTSDNWYYLHIARFGIVGLIVFALPFLKVIKRIYNWTETENKSRYVVSACIALLFYGMGENVVFNQGVVLSTVIWVFLFRELTEERKEEELGRFNSCDFNKK